MDIEKLIKRLKCPQIQSCPMDGEYPSCKACQKSIQQEVTTALSTLQAENEKLRGELEQVKQDRDALIDDFVDYVTGGVPNPAIFCKNRCDKCTDMRGWCTGKDCKGFYPSGASGQKED